MSSSSNASLTDVDPKKQDNKKSFLHTLGLSHLTNVFNSLVKAKTLITDHKILSCSFETLYDGKKRCT